MSLPYFFADPLSNDDQIELPEDTSKHCIQVLRMQQGEQIILTDGKGTLLTSTIITADRKHCIVQVNSRNHEQQQNRKITIAISLLKTTSRFEWFLEKATEIGVTEIIPLICKRTEKQYFRKERMQQILVSAMLQSQQSWLTELHEPTTFENLITNSNYNTKLIAHCEQEEKRSIIKIKLSGTTIILIGPEGDFSNEEIRQALQNNFIPVSLGNTRLRTETAAIVAASLLINQ